MVKELIEKDAKVFMTRHEALAHAANAAEADFMCAYPRHHKMNIYLYLIS